MNSSIRTKQQKGMALSVKRLDGKERKYAKNNNLKLTETVAQI